MSIYLTIFYCLIIFPCKSMSKKSLTLAFRSIQRCFISWLSDASEVLFSSFPCGCTEISLPNRQPWNLRQRESDVNPIHWSDKAIQLPIHSITNAVKENVAKGELTIIPRIMLRVKAADQGITCYLWTSYKKVQAKQARGRNVKMK